MKTLEKIAGEALSNLGYSTHDHKALAGLDCVRATHGRKRHSVYVYKNKQLACLPLEFTDSSVREVWKITERYITSWLAKEG